MAYEARNLSCLSYMNGYTLWHYKTRDAGTTVDKAGYFNESAAMLRIGDFILYNTLTDSGVGDSGVMVVLANAGGIVDVSNPRSFVAPAPTSAPNAAPAVALSGDPTQDAAALAISNMPSQSSGLVYKVTDDNGLTYRTATAPIAPALALSNLAMRTVHSVQIAATNALGQGPWSSAVTFTTAAGTGVSKSLAVGDSISNGVGLPAPTTSSWRNRVGAAYGAASTIVSSAFQVNGSVLQATLVNGTSPGASPPVRGRIASTIAQAADRLEIAGGYNDARYADQSGAFNVGAYKSDYQQIIAAMLSSTSIEPSGIVILPPYYAPDSLYTSPSSSVSFKGSNRSVHEAYVDAARAVAEEYGVALADTYYGPKADFHGKIADNLLMQSDLIHPNDAYHLYIAAKVLRATPTNKIARPASIASSTPGAGQLTVSWRAVDDAIAFEVAIGVNGTYTYGDIQTVSGTTSTFNGLAAGDYVARVRAQVGHSWGPWSHQRVADKVAVAGQVAPPMAASTVTAGAATATSVSLAYSAVGGATGYDVRYSSDEGTHWSAPAEIGASPYTLAGLSASTAYLAQVRGKNGSGSGPWSTSARFTTPAAGAAPSAPTVTPGTPTSTSQAVSVASSSATSFDYRCYVTSAGASGAYLNVTGAGSATIGLASLTAGTGYTIEVIARNGFGPSAARTATFTTAANSPAAGVLGVLTLSDKVAGTSLSTIRPETGTLLWHPATAFSKGYTRADAVIGSGTPAAGARATASNTNEVYVLGDAGSADVSWVEATFVTPASNSDQYSLGVSVGMTTSGGYYGYEAETGGSGTRFFTWTNGTLAVVSTIVSTPLTVSSQHRLALVYTKSTNGFTPYIDGIACGAITNAALAASQGTGVGFQFRQGSKIPTDANSYILQSVRCGTGAYVP